MRKVIVPVSGGIDSAYLLIKAQQEGYEPIPVFIRDNAELSYENKCVFKVTNHILGINPVQLKVPTCKQIEVQYPIEHPHLNTPGLVYWSGYKALMYSACLAYGGAIGADEIWFGVYEWNDHFIDELPENAKKFRDMWASLYPELKVPTIEFPLMGSTKVETIKKLKQFDFPFDLTYSCFKDNSRGIHCGKCLGCKDRKNSFEQAGVTDTANFKWSSFYTKDTYPFTLADLQKEKVIVLDYIDGSYINRRTVPVGSIITQGYWFELFQYFLKTYPDVEMHRLPTYFGFLDSIRQFNKKGKYWQEKNLTFIHNDGLYYPIVNLIDGDKEDGSSIVTTYGEGWQLEAASLFWKFTKNLRFFGLTEKTEGCLETVIVDVHNMTKRFRRYLSKFAFNVYCTNKSLCEHHNFIHLKDDELCTVLDKYHTDALNYWETKGKINSLTDNYVFQPIHQDIILVEIPDQGVAYLSQTLDGLYWDYSLRKDTPNVGNALLQKSCEVVKQLGKKYLDLGVAFFDWKTAWSEQTRKHKGIEYKD